MNRLNLAISILGLCLFGTGVAVLSAHAGDEEPQPIHQVLPGSPAIPTTDPPTTTTTVAVTTTTAKPRTSRNEVKPLRLVTTTTAKPQIGTATSIVRRTPLEIAQGEVGKDRPEYFDSSGWCYRLVNWAVEQAQVPGWKSENSQSALNADAISDGRFTQTPSVSDMVFIDLFGPGNGQVTHVGIVENVGDDGQLRIIQGNGDPDPSVVTETDKYRVGDGFVVGFASFEPRK